MEGMELESQDPAGLGRILLAMFAQDALIVEKTLKTQCPLFTSLALTSLPAWEWWGGSGFPDCQAHLPLAQGSLTLLGLGEGMGGPQTTRGHFQGAPGSQIKCFPCSQGTCMACACKCVCTSMCGPVCVHICASLIVHICMCVHHFWGRVGEFRR